MVKPKRKPLRLRVQRVKKPDFAHVAGQPAAGENSGNDFVAAAVAGENDASNLPLPQDPSLPESIRGLAHESLESVSVLQFAAERIRSIQRALRDNQDGVAPAGGELLRQPILDKRVGHVVAPTMKMNHKVHVASGPKPLGDEQRHMAVLIMVRGGEDFIAVLMPLGAERMGKRRGGEIGEDQPLKRAGVILRQVPGDEA